MNRLDLSNTSSHSLSLQEQIAQRLLKTPSGEGVYRDIAEFILEQEGVVNIDIAGLEYYLSDEVISEMSDTTELKAHKIHQAYSKLKSMSLPDSIEDTTQDEEHLIKLRADIDTNKHNLGGLRTRFTSKDGIGDALRDEAKQKLVDQWLEEKKDLETSIEDANQEIIDIDEVLIEKDDPETDRLPVEFQRKEKSKRGLLANIDAYEASISEIEEYVEYEQITVVGMDLETTQFALALAEANEEEILTSWNKTEQKMISINEEIKTLQTGLSKTDASNQQALAHHIDAYDGDIEKLRVYLKEILETEEDFRQVMDGLSDIANSQDITDIASQLKPKLGVEIGYNIMNYVQGVISGSATAMGLSQIVPKYLYEKSLFLASDGTPSTAAVYIIAGLAGAGVGLAGSTIFRGRIKKGIQSLAMKRKSVLQDHNILKSYFQGPIQGLFLNVNNKIDTFRTVTSGAAMAVVFGLIIPTEDGGIYNAASVPSNMSGTTTFLYGEQVRDRSKEQVVDAALDGTLSIEQVQADIESTQGNISRTTDRYVDTELSGGGINSTSGAGPVANIKNKVIHGAYFNTNQASKYTNVIQGTRFENTSFDTQLSNIQNKYDTKIEAFFDTFNVDDLDDELTDMLEFDPANMMALFTMSLELKNSQVQTSGKFDALTQDIENYIEELNQLGSDVKSVLTDIERLSGDLGKDETLSDEFIPQIDNIDIGAIQTAKSEIQDRLSELDPFIVDVEAALEKTTTHSKELFYTIAAIAVLIEILALLVLGPAIYRGERKRFDDIADRLEAKYRDLITTSKDHKLLAPRANPLPDKLFSGRVVDGLPNEAGLKKLMNNIKLYPQQSSIGNEYQNYAHNLTEQVLNIIKGALINLGSVSDSKPFNSELAKSHLYDGIPATDKKIADKQTPHERGADDIERLTAAVSGDNIRSTVEKLMIPGAGTDRVAQRKDASHIVLETLQGEGIALNARTHATMNDTIDTEDQDAV